MDNKIPPVNRSDFLEIFSNFTGGLYNDSQLNIFRSNMAHQDLGAYLCCGYNRDHGVAAIQL